MAQTDRLFKLKRWLDTGRCMTREFLLRELETSEATLKRDIAMLRDDFNAPLEWDSELRGWRLDRNARDAGPQYELPGLWFTAEEIHALLTMQHLLAHLDTGGLLGPHVEPLMKRLGHLLGSGAPVKADVARRIRLQTVGARKLHLPHFQAVGSALLRRQRMILQYRSRSRADLTEREVSPQRLVHYRDNWYLDAWCHKSNGLRTFAVDCVRSTELLDAAAQDIDPAQLDAELGGSYGIFSGAPSATAVLRFTADRARWIAAEQWHPQQQGIWLPDGSYELSVPYHRDEELILDILRYGPDVEVMGPAALREEVIRRLRSALDRY